MATLTTPVRRVGNSLGILLPRETVKKMDLREGSVVNIEIQAKQKVSGFGIARGAPSFDRKRDRDDIHGW